MKHKDCYIPHTCVGLVEWLGYYYPADLSSFKRMKKKQLYAIFFSTREKIARGVIVRRFKPVMSEV